MEQGTPTKPPRGVKQYREPSGLLMSLIRTLSTSETNEQREKEKNKLEKDHERSNKRLEELVSQHNQELTQVMQLFVKVSSLITSSREKIKTVKDNLHLCKTLLRCRRNELKKLWLEGIEHKHSLQLLEGIDQVREVPSQLEIFLSKKQYLNATQLLTTTLSLGDGNLAGIEALREVRTELQTKKQILYGKLMEELKHHLYVIPYNESSSFRRQGSGKECFSPFQRTGDLRGSNRGSRARRKLLDASMKAGTVEQDHENPSDELDSMDREEKLEHFSGIISECLGLLQKLGEAVETIKSQMHGELMTIVSNATKNVLESSQSMNSSKMLLLNFLEIIFEQFRKVADGHKIVLKYFTKTAEKYRLDVRLYEMADVWSKIQTVLQGLLTDYLDADNVLGDSIKPSSYSDPAVVDISSYFSKKKSQRQKKVHLFKFDCVSHSLTANSHSDDHSKGPYGGKSKQLVCPRDINNVTVIYIPLRRFIDEIEQSIDNNSGSPCMLNNFLSDFIRDRFMHKHHFKASLKIENISKSHDAWKEITDPDMTKKMGLSRPVLMNTVTVEKCMTELKELMKSLPAYADKFLTIICNVLRSYREICQSVYRGIVQPDSEDKKIWSASWLKDDDMSRFLKSLPNWMELQTHKPTHRRGKNLRREETTEEESPEDIRQRNVKEAEILASNMGESGIKAHEILSNVSQLKKLAQLNESMEWFAGQILQIITEVKEFNSDGSGDSFKSHISDVTIQTLYQSVHEFTDLADMCLLVLHLEVRVQCFHYLLPKSEGSSKKFDFMYEEPDPKVQELSKVLINVDEAMVCSLQPRKTKYIFEGLGDLIAKILISSCQYMDKIEQNGIQRMCRNMLTLQQTLTNITSSREVALDHAKQFFELFYKTPDEILTTVLEKGPQFTDMEYINALQLINRTHPNAYGNMSRYLQRLSDILGEIGVTV
ncbi:exocyst componenet sec8, putative [Pediculus humanus corporis]|uniref:Exocyst complex component Sec8 n=1 Tax=Pediculus humanus subsp. corporis TaxID=121224 RepID=E0VYL8_PEDHC|nr:exocyst component sec8, putative [Pediculus humanus corporis]EEB18474.1 exocyst componenet sec8, putative [Pediculus humanus corporis]